MPQQVRVQPNSYFDSVTLMVLGRAIASQPGVQEAVLVMATAMNKELLARVGLLTDAAAAASGADLVVALRAESQAALAEATAAVEAGLKHRPAVQTGSGVPAVVPRTLRAGVQALPGANLALISVPGAYAAHAAHQALDQGLDVMLFSDNVALADEVTLKEEAHARGLLLMGPDCGTAMLGGVGLGFANVVQPGPIGVVAASGTGAQEFSALVDRLGSGLSQIIGTGGRDLSEAVGGRMMLDGLARLAADPATQVIVLIAKPPHPTVAARVTAAAATGKPVVQFFLGAAPAGDGAAGGHPKPARHNLHPVTSLTEAAALAVALATGTDVEDLQQRLEPSAAHLQEIAAIAAERLRPNQRYVRGLFTGGTLCEQAVRILEQDGRTVYCNVHHDPSRRPANPQQSQGHTLVDLGDDLFTQGRPHPMIEPSVRHQRLLQEAADPTVAVLLLDVVLGHCSHPDPAADLLPVLAQARTLAGREGRELAVVLSVTGTRLDPQGLAGQQQRFQQAGCRVAPTAAAAARVAALITAGGVEHD